jgi:hypothetical protein
MRDSSVRAPTRTLRRHCDIPAAAPCCRSYRPGRAGDGHDWTGRFPPVARAALSLKVVSCLIDGEAVACDTDGLPVFDRLRGRRDDRRVFLYAFDLIEFNGDDLRGEAIETRKAALARLLRKIGADNASRALSRSRSAHRRMQGSYCAPTRGHHECFMKMITRQSFLCHYYERWRKTCVPSRNTVN